MVTAAHALPKRSTLWRLDESTDLPRQQGRARRDRSRPAPDRSRRHHPARHRDRHLRLRPAHLSRQDPDDGERRHPRPRVHGHRRGGRPGVTSVKRGDRVVVPFTIACGDCFFCSRSLFAACETTNPGRGAILNKKQTRPGAALFGYSHLYGGVPGRPGRVRARAEGQRRPAADPGLDLERRAGAVPLRHPADRLSGRRQRRRRARLDRRDLRRRPGRADGGGIVPSAGRRAHLHGRPPCLPARLRGRDLRRRADQLRQGRRSGRDHHRAHRPARRRLHDRRGRLRGQGQHARDRADHPEARRLERQGTAPGDRRDAARRHRQRARASTRASSTASCSATPSRRGSRSRAARPTPSTTCPSCSTTSRTAI